MTIAEANALLAESFVLESVAQEAEATILAASTENQRTLVERLPERHQRTAIKSLGRNVADLQTAVAQLPPDYVPSHLNGYPVIAALPVRICERVVLVDRGPEVSNGRYVTAIHCFRETAWYYGHYFDELPAAEADLHRRYTGDRYSKP